jgi:Asp-tRNA(Asn)/Glu-tRNA(Gln) amidotransferase A subunit family amidase
VPSVFYCPPVLTLVCIDEPEKVEGAPGAIQVVGKPMMDEELLEIMKVIEETLDIKT